MDPLLIVEQVGLESVMTPEYSGDVATLILRIPVTRAADVDRNDTYRREVTAKIAEVLPKPE